MRAGGLVLRGGLLVLGLAIGRYGAALLLGKSGSTLWSVTVWLAGGVLLHDAVLAPAVVAFWWAARRFLPDVIAGPLAGGLIVLGSLTIMAIPVLGRFRTVASNPTLLDRDYAQGWWIVAGIVLTGVVAWAAELAVRRMGRDRDS